MINPYLEYLIEGIFIGFMIGVFGYYLISKTNKKSKEVVAVMGMIMVIMMAFVMILNILKVI